VEGDSSLTIYTYRFGSSAGRELTIAEKEVVYKLIGLLDDSS